MAQRDRPHSSQNYHPYPRDNRPSSSSSYRSSSTPSRASRELEEVRGKDNEKVILSTDLTFIMSGKAGLDHRVFHSLLKNEAFHRVSVKTGLVMARATKKVDFIWTELKYVGTGMSFDKRIYRIPCRLKNLLDVSTHNCITDKGKLHMAIMEHEREANRLLAEGVADAETQISENFYLSQISRNIARTRRLKDVARLEEGEILILRPTADWAWAGRGIHRVENQEQFETGKKQLLSECKDSIASEYIQNPFLWHSKENPEIRFKTHFRMYWLVIAEVNASNVRSEFFSLLWEKGEMFIAADPYRNEDFANAGMHDTHGKSTPRNMFFPYDVQHILTKDQINGVVSEMRRVMDGTLARYVKKVKPFSESEFAFEVFGVDFMLDQSLKPILIEINNRIGHQSATDDHDEEGRFAEFTRNYFAWVNENAIGRFLPILQKIPPQAQAEKIQSLNSELN
jgi:hypothetical protein